MSNAFAPPKLRIPVKFVEGRWEYFYGGEVPVGEGAIGDLVIARNAVSDHKFLHGLERRSAHRILEEGVELLVALTIRAEVDPSLRPLLRRLEPAERGAAYYETVRPEETRFVAVTIGIPTPAAAKRLNSDTGGVWLHLEGAQPKGVSVSSVHLPAAIDEKPLESLNHAFTRLSTVFEPWRKSHTGNIYTRVLYQERDRKWYPLEVLRRATEATEEQLLIRERWAEIAKAILPDLAADL